MDNRAIEGEWVYDESTDYYSHKCSACDSPAIYQTNYEDDWDEGLDGKWRNLGMIATGITEHLTPYCPHCGAKIKNGEEEQANV